MQSSSGKASFPLLLPYSFCRKRVIYQGIPFIPQPNACCVFRMRAWRCARESGCKQGAAFFALDTDKVEDRQTDVEPRPPARRTPWAALDLHSVISPPRLCSVSGRRLGRRARLRLQKAQRLGATALTPHQGAEDPSPLPCTVWTFSQRGLGTP